MTETALVAGPDPDGLGDALEAEGVDVRRLDGVVSATTLRAAGIEEASLLVLTDVEEATGIAVAKELNPAVRAVTYTAASLPAFATKQADLAVDPALLDVSVVAEELVA